MTVFPLTRKRFLSFPPKRRHRHIALWFEQLYSRYRGNKDSICRESVFREYRTVLNWLGMHEPDFSEKFGKFLADSFHLHWEASGLPFREIDSTADCSRPDSDLPYIPCVNAQVLLDNLRSGYNVGSIFRTADGAGWEGVLRYGFTPGPESPAVQKTALGAHKWLPSEKPDSLERLKTGGADLVILETDRQAVDIYRYPWKEPLILALGNEEYGISREVRDISDACVKIPMLGRKNCLNVANSFAVAAYAVNQILGKFEPTS